METMGEEMSQRWPIPGSESLECATSGHGRCTGVLCACTCHLEDEHRAAIAKMSIAHALYAEMAIETLLREVESVR